MRIVKGPLPPSVLRPQPDPSAGPDTGEEPVEKVKRKCGRPRNPIPRHKRDSHIMAEHRRRGKIQECFQVLKTIVPRYTVESGRNSKSNVLINAVDHCKILQREVQDLNSNIEELKTEVAALQQDVREHGASDQRVSSSTDAVLTSGLAQQFRLFVTNQENNEGWASNSFLLKIAEHFFQSYQQSVRGQSSVSAFAQSVGRWATTALSMDCLRSVCTSALESDVDGRSDQVLPFPHQGDGCADKAMASDETFEFDNRGGYPEQLYCNGSDVNDHLARHDGVIPAEAEVKTVRTSTHATGVKCNAKECSFSDHGIDLDGISFNQFYDGTAHSSSDGTARRNFSGVTHRGYSLPSVDAGHNRILHGRYVGTRPRDCTAYDAFRKGGLLSTVKGHLHAESAHVLPINSRDQQLFEQPSPLRTYRKTCHSRSSPKAYPKKSCFSLHEEATRQVSTSSWSPPLSPCGMSRDSPSEAPDADFSCKQRVCDPDIALVFSDNMQKSDVDRDHFSVVDPHKNNYQPIYTKSFIRFSVASSPDKNQPHTPLSFSTRALSNNTVVSSGEKCTPGISERSPTIRLCGDRETEGEVHMYNSASPCKTSYLAQLLQAPLPSLDNPHKLGSFPLVPVETALSDIDPVDPHRKVRQCAEDVGNAHMSPDSSRYSQSPSSSEDVYNATTLLANDSTRDPLHISYNKYELESQKRGSRLHHPCVAHPLLEDTKNINQNKEKKHCENVVRRSAFCDLYTNADGAVDMSIKRTTNCSDSTENVSLCPRQSPCSNKSPPVGKAPTSYPNSLLTCRSQDPIATHNIPYTTYLPEDSWSAAYTPHTSTQISHAPHLSGIFCPATHISSPQPEGSIRAPSQSTADSDISEKACSGEDLDPQSFAQNAEVSPTISSDFSDSSSSHWKLASAAMDPFRNPLTSILTQRQFPQTFVTPARDSTLTKNTSFLMSDTRDFGSTANIDSCKRPLYESKMDKHGHVCKPRRLTLSGYS